MKINRIHSITLVLLGSAIVFLNFFNCSQILVKSSQSDAPYPKNIIVFFGDGMGVSHITAGKTLKGELELEKFKIMGLITTHSSDEYITDSAAAGTALATGYKTNNKAIAVSPENEPLKTILEYAEENGKSTGLITTSNITDATPASYATHIDNRNKQSEIAEQLVQSGVDVVFGGGLCYFIPSSQEGSRRRDEKDLVSELEKSYLVITEPEEFNALQENSNVFGLLAMEKLADADERSISLYDMTKKALGILSNNEKGFFLLVENQHIDGAGHSNDAENIIQETIDIDNAVRAGFEFLEQNTNTLILVISDHETGGFVITKGSIEERTIDNPIFASRNHTGTMVPIFAYGPQCELFGGIHDNTFIGKKLIEFVNKQ